MSQKNVGAHPPFSTFFEVVIFGGIFVDFGFAFGASLDRLGRPREALGGSRKRVPAGHFGVFGGTMPAKLEKP